MDTLRYGHAGQSRPVEASRSRRIPEPTQAGSIPRVMQPYRTAMPSGSSGNAIRASQPSLSSRQPSKTQSAVRPSQQSSGHPWGGTTVDASRIPVSHAHDGSVSSSSGRSYDSQPKQPRKLLRRKKSSVSQGITTTRGTTFTASSTSSAARSRDSLDPCFGFRLDRGNTHSSAQIQVAEAVEIQKTTAGSPVIYPELDRYRDHKRPVYSSDDQAENVPFRLATHDLPPPTPGSIIFSANSSQVSAASGSPSTKWSASPGPGPYSRDTTPTSVSSQSPGLVAPSRVNQVKPRQFSPALSRPPVTRRRAGSTPNEENLTNADRQGLDSVRESLTSSSSNSTVRDGDRNAKKGRKRGTKLPPPPPSPPPRKSSQKFRKNDETERSPHKQATEAIPTPNTGSSPAKGQRSPQMGSVSPPRQATPRRPSRDGTPSIQSRLQAPVPIIRSNISSTSLPVERRGSESSDTGSMPSLSSSRPVNTSTSSLPRPGDSSSNRSRRTSPCKSSTLSPPDAGRPNRTPSPNLGSSFNSRFPFFGRRKQSSDGTQQEKKDKKKTSRKGPAAGTGHEGYGRVGSVRRRSSGPSNVGHGLSGTMSSQESLASDPFLSDRVNPVVIAGGEIIENRNASSEITRSESNQSLPLSRTSTDSKVGTEIFRSKDAAVRTTLWPSSTSPSPTSFSRIRRPSAGSDSDDTKMKSTLAFRRSVQRLGASPDSPLRLPHPINTSGVASSPMTSFDTSVMSDDSYIEVQREVSRGRNGVQHGPKKLTKRTRSPRKWNLFSRSQSQPSSKRKDEKIEPVAATIEALEKKPMAFYTMMDSSEQGDSEDPDLHEALRNANVYGDSSSSQVHLLHPSANAPPSRDSPINASPKPSLMGKTGSDYVPQQTRPQLGGSTLGASSINAGRSRLQQVGRIPKVVSNRHDQPSPRSFSRPFRASLQLPPQMEMTADVDSIAKGPSPPKPTTPLPELTWEESPSGSGTNFSSQASNPQYSPEVARAGREFIAFPPRKDSEGTVGTSSSSSARYTFAGATAVVPDISDPPAEDEIWDEYDDLFGDDGTKAPLSATSSKGISFHLEPYHSKLSQDKPMESPTIKTSVRMLSTHSRAPTHSSSYSADMTERIRAAFEPHPSPTTPFSVSDFVASYSKRSDNSLHAATKQSPMPHRRSASADQARNSGASSSSDDGSPLAQVNLRVGSMTVSKWLTFGHVLFSDVRHELVPVEGSLKRHSILVIDGLGNDDWSFYAAETYPAATFFNLSPRAPLPAEMQNSPTGFPLSPPNHHQTQYHSHLDKFPFAPQSFSSVVYRFPVAASEAHYRNVLSEIRRVLKPEGFLELSILDVDLNNMGNHGRRAVRRLKECIHEQDPETNLASTADLIVRLLGKVGFSNIKAARVGVPVTSPALHSHGVQDAKSANRERGAKKDKPSLAEMMSDNSPTADENITKMVSRVGRWWYSRCYQNVAESGSTESMWNDKLLLSECENLGTSFKLMVCCARAPDRITSY